MIVSYFIVERRNKTSTFPKFHANSDFLYRLLKLFISGIPIAVFFLLLSLGI